VLKNALIEEKIEVVTETTTLLINQQSVRAVLEYLKYLYFRENIYKENFFALISQTPREIQLLDLNSIKLFDIVKRVIEEYKLFGNDFHLIRFLNAVSNYSDIEALLFEYERLDTPAAASDISGVRVLTVHKSKGLEYEHVIVVDRLKKPPVARNAIIYEYEGIALENVYLRTKGRDALDARYAKALEKEQLLVKEDSLNALYVAFTRARDNLIIIQKSEKSSFDLLDLEVASYGELRVTPKKKELKEELQALEYKELYYGTQSEILALESSDDEDLNAINFGLAMHYMLEMMADFTHSSIDTAKSMMINKFGFTLQESDIEDIVHRVELFCENEQVKSLTQGECFKEKALRYKNNLRYVDLLVKCQDGSFNVLDYKSSLAFSEHHLKQVRAYVSAIKEITHEHVEGFICYMLADAVTIVQV